MKSNLLRMGITVCVTCAVILSPLPHSSFFRTNYLLGFFPSPSKAHAADPSICYPVADSGDTLVSINRITGTPQSNIGNTGTTDIEADVLSLDGNTLYAANASTFGTLNTSTGSYTSIGSFGSGTGAEGPVTFSDVDGLTIDGQSGIFYGAVRRGAASTNDVLIQIDPNTGSHVNNAFGVDADYIVIDTAALGPLSGSTLYDVDDIAVDPTTGLMYGIANASGGGDRLVLIDIADGSVTDVGRLTYSGGNIDDMEGLGFFNDGTLYGTTGTGGTTATRNSLWQINVSTAVSAKIAAFSSGTDYESVACLTGGSNIMSGTVFYDTDGSGTLNGGESGTAGVTVQLYIDQNNDGAVDGGDTLIQTTTTDVNGTYQFEVAIADNFVMNVDTGTLPPATNTMSTDNVEEANFAGYNLSDNGNNFGHTTVASVGDTIYKDDSGDGSKQSQELGLAGVVVELDNGNCISGSTCPTDTTDVNGSYLFVGLIPGTYTITVLSGIPPSYQATGDPDEAGVCTVCDQRSIFVLGSGDLLDRDFGFQPSTPLSKSVSAENASPGETVTYTLTLSLENDEIISNGTITDSVPAGTSYVGNSDTPEAASEPIPGGIGDVVWDLGSHSTAVPGYVPGLQGSSGTVDLIAIQDTVIGNIRPSRNFDGSLVRTKGLTGDDRRSLIEFNVVTDSIPPGATIDTATLQLESTTSNAMTVDVHRAILSWNEATVTWNSWNGGGVSGVDYDAARDGTISVSGSPGLQESTNLAPLVQEWRDGTANEGILLKTSNTSESLYRDTESTTGQKPTLVVSWLIPDEPSLGTTLTVQPTHVGTDDLITVTMTLTASESVLNVAPSAPAITPTNGVSATLVSGPAPASATVGPSGASFTWIYQASSSGNIGQLIFSGNASGSGETWAVASSNSVIVANPFVFQVQLDEPNALTQIDNQAMYAQDGVFPIGIASNLVTTTLTGVVEGTLYIDEDKNGTYSPITDTVITDVDVVITDSEGITYTVTTDANGYFSQTVPAGSTTVNVDDNDPDMIIGVSLTAGSSDPTVVAVPANGTATDNTGYTLPPAALSVTKSLVTPSSGTARASESIVFTIGITNSGQITVTELTLTDVYDAQYLQFDLASIVPDLASTGVQTWTGTTTSGSLRSNLPLAPGEAFTFTVAFIASMP